jgi:thioredoxin reductase
MTTDAKEKKVAIIGSGPSGLTAGIYTSRAGLKTKLFAGMQPGGQLTTTTEVENFPCAWDPVTKQGMMGPSMMNLMTQQAQHFGTEVIYDGVSEVKINWQIPNKKMMEDLLQKANNENKTVVVDVLFANKEGAIFSQKRSESRKLLPNLWEVTGGHLEDGESIEECIKREIVEETNLNLINIKYYLGEADSEINGTSYRIFSFLVELDMNKEMKLEETKISDFKWVDGVTVPFEILNQNRIENDTYIHDIVKKAWKVWNGELPQFSLKGDITEDLGSFDALIIATGASAKYLGLPNEEKWIGRGYHTCATCDGFFYKGKTLAIVGGGDSAMEEATYLAKLAQKVYLIHRSSTYRASNIMLERAKNNPKIEFLEWKKVNDFVVNENNKLGGLVIEDTKSAAKEELKVDGLFVAIGHTPNTAFLGGILSTDEAGYLIPRQRLLPALLATEQKIDAWWSKYATMSEIEGIFVAGDVEDKIYRQAITASGDGCRAAIECERWLEEKLD